ncbi:Cof-type HAD-IIB family hydrolase [Sebaldella sp. S0638]|uniref:Cof-type HAD-IIB family hydrolase n=1 Tax=Sebaldella sp. S0638 TaxID=2957809 RepID=UPI00209CC87E|nr:HAD family hydrolase [Sebaldella sp. S0638]MCP1224382.1 Cof-type HAD-IIB family hydrolase [Sebaldella sp. S0638]
MIKLFISDLDGTLIHEPKTGIEPNERNVKAIRLLHENDIEFAVATGRFDYHILEIEGYIDSRNYRIGLNGGTIYTKDNILIRENTFTYDVIDRLRNDIEKNYIKELNYMVLQTVGAKRYIKYPNFLKKMANFYKYQRQFNAIHYSGDIVKELAERKEKIIKLLVSTDPANKYTLQEILRERHSDAEITISGPKSIEIGPKGNTKGNAIKMVMEKENLTENEVAFIGDSYNDVSGFEVCKYSFAMSHADDFIKSKAAFVVDSVADAVEKVLRVNGEKEL